MHLSVLKKMQSPNPTIKFTYLDDMIKLVYCDYGIKNSQSDSSFYCGFYF